MGYFVLGYIWVMYTHLGCFGAQGEAGGSEKALKNVFHQSGFPIRQVVPVGLGPDLLLGSLGSVFHRKKVVYS